MAPGAEEAHRPDRRSMCIMDSSGVPPTAHLLAGADRSADAGRDGKRRMSGKLQAAMPTCRSCSRFGGQAI